MTGKCASGVHTSTCRLLDVDDPVDGDALFLVEAALGEAVGADTGRATAIRSRGTSVGDRPNCRRTRRSAACRRRRGPAAPGCRHHRRCLPETRAPGAAARVDGDSPPASRTTRQHRLMPPTRRRRHQQLAVHGLVAVAVVGQGAHVGGGVVARERHGHSIGSAAGGWQVGDTRTMSRDTSGADHPGSD